MTIKLWHCHGSRSLRVLWLLEEIGLDYHLELLPFPPRVFQKEYLKINSLGTVPYLTDGDITMTESTAICEYLVNRYNFNELLISKDHEEYGNYLNWLYQSDSTYTFPLAINLRYKFLESNERKSIQVAEDYAKWFLARLRRLDNHIKGRKYLCDDRFTIADITVGYALYFADLIGLSEQFSSQVTYYLKRLMEREKFKRANAIGVDESIFTKL